MQMTPTEVATAAAVAGGAAAAASQSSSTADTAHSSAATAHSSAATAATAAEPASPAAPQPPHPGHCEYRGTNLFYEREHLTAGCGVNDAMYYRFMPDGGACAPPSVVADAREAHGGVDLACAGHDQACRKHCWGARTWAGAAAVSGWHCWDARSHDAHLADPATGACPTAAPTTLVAVRGQQ